MLHFSTNLFLFSPRLAFTFFFSCWALAWAVPLLTELKKNIKYCLTTVEF